MGSSFVSISTFVLNPTPNWFLFITGGVILCLHLLFFSNCNLFKAHYHLEWQITYQPLSLAFYPTLSPSSFLFKSKTNSIPMYGDRGVLLCLHLHFLFKSPYKFELTMTYDIPTSLCLWPNPKSNEFLLRGLGILKWRQSVCLHILSTESLQHHQLLKYDCIETIDTESAVLKMATQGERIAYKNGGAWVFFL